MVIAQAGIPATISRLSINTGFDQSRFDSTLAEMQALRIGLIGSLETNGGQRESVGYLGRGIRYLLREGVAKATESVIAGSSLMQGLEESGHFPKSMTGMIGIGEEAGALEKTLSRLSHFFRLQLDYRLGNQSKALEPILLMVVFGMVLFLALSVFLPMLKMNYRLKR